MVYEYEAWRAINGAMNVRFTSAASEPDAAMFAHRSAPKEFLQSLLRKLYISSSVEASKPLLLAISVLEGIFAMAPVEMFSQSGMGALSGCFTANCSLMVVPSQPPIK